MPKQRAKGAAKPYHYWASQSWVDAQGLKQHRRVQRWKIQLDLGKDEIGKRIRKTFTGKTSKEAKDKYDKARGDIVEYGAITDTNATLRKYVNCSSNPHSNESATPRGATTTGKCTTT